VRFRGNVVSGLRSARAKLEPQCELSHKDRGGRSKNGLILIEIDPESGILDTKEGQLSIISMNYFLTFSRYPAEATESSVLCDWVHMDFLDPRDTSKAIVDRLKQAPQETWEPIDICMTVVLRHSNCLNRWNRKHRRSAITSVVSIQR
jgi:hypothetical protein